MYSAWNLLPAPEYDGEDDHTRWEDGPVLEVTVNVRSRSERGARGRTSKIVDDPMGLRAACGSRRDALPRRRAAAVGELAAASGQLEDVILSPDALGALCVLLTDAMAQRERPSDEGRATDPGGLLLTVYQQPGRTMTIRSQGGFLELRDTVVELVTRGKSG